MRNRRSSFLPPDQGYLVEYFLDTAYDTVKLVADNLDDIINVSLQVQNGNNFATEEWVTTQLDNLVGTTFASAEQGALADTAVQPGDLGNAAYRNVETLIITESQISDLGDYLTSVDWTDILNKPGTFPPESHTHSLTQISDAGTMAAQNDAPNDGNQYARQNGSWQQVSGGVTVFRQEERPTANAVGDWWLT